MTPAFLGLPNPFSLLGGLVGDVLGLGADIVGSVAGSILGEIIGGLTAAVIGALVDMVASVLGFFWDASEPELSGWFAGQNAPYEQMVLLSAPLLVVFVFAGVIQGALAGDSAGMLRMVLLRLPGAVLAMSITVMVADLLLKVTDDLSRQMLDSFRGDIEQVGTVLASLRMSGGLSSMFLLLVFGLFGLMASIVLVVLLFVRGSLIYLVAAFSPLIFASSVWEPMRGGVRKLAEIGFALIISKLAIAIALAVSSAALVSSWPNHEPTEMPTPELAAVQAQQSQTQSVGIVLSAVVMFTVAAFMPFLLFRLMPVAEAAMVAQGVSPLRAFHSASATANSVRYNPATSAVMAARQAQRQSGPSADGSGSGSGSASRSPAGDGKSDRPASTPKKGDKSRPAQRPERKPQGQEQGARQEGDRRPGKRKIENFDDRAPHPGQTTSGQQGKVSPSSRSPGRAGAGKDERRSSSAGDSPPREGGRPRKGAVKPKDDSSPATRKEAKKPDSRPSQSSPPGRTTRGGGTAKPGGGPGGSGAGPAGGGASPS